MYGAVAYDGLLVYWSMDCCAAGGPVEGDVMGASWMVAGWCLSSDAGDVRGSYRRSSFP